MIKDYSLYLLEVALNKALYLDDSMASKLKPLNAKTIELSLTPFQWSFYLTIENAKIKLATEVTASPDTIIYSSPLGFIRLSLLPASKVRSLFHDGIKIECDVSLGQQLKRIMDEIDIDWEGHIASFTGDVVAHQLGLGVKKLKSVSRNIQSSVAFQLSSYFKDQNSCLPTKEMLNDFF